MSFLRPIGVVLILHKKKLGKIKGYIQNWAQTTLSICTFFLYKFIKNKFISIQLYKCVETNVLK